MNSDRADWFKSSYSPANGDCVEITISDPTHIGIRDSTNPDGARLNIPTDAWTPFTRAAATGHFEGFEEVAPCQARPVPLVRPTD